MVKTGVWYLNNFVLEQKGKPKLQVGDLSFHLPCCQNLALPWGAGQGRPVPLARFHVKFGDVLL